MNLRIALVCLGLGTLIEAGSAGFRLWLYDPPWLRVANVVFVFGGFFGWLSSAIADRPGAQRFLVGAVVGIVYEALNLTTLHAWRFPQDRLLVLRGPVALVLGVGVAWGLLPLAAPLLVAR